MNENVFLLHAFLLGIEITFLYDILRILRRVLYMATAWCHWRILPSGSIVREKCFY